MNISQRIGLAAFVLALLLFTVLPAVQQYSLDRQSLQTAISNDYHREAILAEAESKNLLGKNWGSTFTLQPVVKKVLQNAQRKLSNKAAEGIPKGVDEWDYKLGDWKIEEYTQAIVKAGSHGPVSQNPWWFLLLTIGLGLLGGLLYILPEFNRIPGIKNNHIYRDPMTRGLTLGWRSVFLSATLIGVMIWGWFYMKDFFWPLLTLVVGSAIVGLVFFQEHSQKYQPARSSSPSFTGWLGILTGVYLISFYVLLYWAPVHITAWVQMVSPVSEWLSGNPASRWFLYGLLYTLVILVMGLRMMAKYRHNRYQLIRTGSVMFFQTAFAFLIPEILVRLNYPYFDFKNIWPLNYTFFYDWNLNNLISSGQLGMFMLFWGIALIVIAVPVITYFFGKRWYCSWVCGCGGLAETLGDPYRQLSDKSLRAWKFERWIIHLVLVFVVLMTIATLYAYLPPSDFWLNQTTFLILMMIGTGGAMGYVYYRWKTGKVDISRKGIYIGLGVTTLLWILCGVQLLNGSGQFLWLPSGQVQKWYGFIIGAAFAGVVGTGFYPLMGNRVWCRFGCPLAAYLGLVQRIKSRFRITTNGGQCISCGNCSTYCEMGIDVRWYAQRGQNIVRSSCVGCGICAAVCPRGVLRLENGSADIDQRTTELKILKVSATGVEMDA